jgi:KaiC/GvpD/RAD55 family RecA-like ATPase
MKDWHLVENIPVRWLVDGLLPADGFSAVIGKPKAGKSQLIRHLIAAVIKSHPFLHRQVNIPKGTGRVLYIHLDRKDKPGRVVEELRQLGITGEDEVSRLKLMVADDLPVAPALENPAYSFANRLEWLQKEVSLAQPNLIVIDLLQQFVCSSNVNDYAEALTSVNRLQDALTNIGYRGALLVTLHSRKSTNSEQPFDDALGSTAYRGSFTTLILLKQNRAEGRYTITSDQTEREDPWNEIDETELLRDPDGTLSLGRPVVELKEDKKVAKLEADIERVLRFINDHPGRETDEIINSLAMAKARFLEIADTVNDLLIITGRGIKGEPKRYSLRSFDVPISACPEQGGPSDHRPVLSEEPFQAVYQAYW